MEQGKISVPLPTPRFGTKKEDEKINFCKLLKKCIKKHSKSLNTKNKKFENETFPYKGINKKRSLHLPLVKINISCVRKDSQDKNKFSNFLKKKFYLRNDFDENHTQEFLNDKEIAFEEVILSDEIIEQSQKSLTK